MGEGRVLIVTRDRHPARRVDLTELFSRHLAQSFDLTWLMARAEAGPGGSIEQDGERFALSGRPRGLGAPTGVATALSWLILQIAVARRVAAGAFDLVQVRDAALSAQLFLIAARLGRRPFVYWMSFPILESYRARAAAAPWPLGLARRAYAALGGFVLYRLVLPGADHVFVQSPCMAKDLAARGVSTARITPVPMGVSTALYNPVVIAPAMDARLNGRIVLLYLGAVEPEREVGFLPAMLAQVVAAGFDAVLVVVGASSPKNAAAFADRAAEVGMAARLIFTGHRPLADALAYVRRADICLAPYPVSPAFYLSATPTKLVEYLAMGRPVVASPHPDQSAVIAASGAGVIAPLSADGFAEAVIDLLRAPDRAERIGALGPPWVAAHRDYAALAERVAGVYRRLIAGGGA